MIVKLNYRAHHCARARAGEHTKHLIKLDLTPG